MRTAILKPGSSMDQQVKGHMVDHTSVQGINQVVATVTEMEPRVGVKAQMLLAGVAVRYVYRITGNFGVVKFWRNGLKRANFFIGELNIWRIICISYCACTLEKI